MNIIALENTPPDLPTALETDDDRFLVKALSKISNGLLVIRFPALIDED